MRMKKDQSHQPTQTQVVIGVVSEYILAYDIFSNPSDSKSILLEKIKLLNLNIKNIVADVAMKV